MGPALGISSTCREEFKSSGNGWHVLQLVIILMVLSWGGGLPLVAVLTRIASDFSFKIPISVSQGEKICQI